MSHEAQINIQGRIGDVFFHRFVIELESGQRVLADIGPHGVDAFPLQKGLEISATGEMKPSELKVTSIARKGEAPVAIAQKKKAPHSAEDSHHGPADPAAAQAAVRAAGISPLGAPRRKPKHFEVLGRKDGRLVECHVAFDGHVRKEKPVSPQDLKWSAELANVA